MIEQFLSLLSRCHEPLRVLELGCGRDLFAVRLAEMGIEVTALDLVARFQELQERYVHLTCLRYIQGDMTELCGLPSGYYCGVVARQSLHMADPGRQGLVSGAVHRVLHAGGVFWILDGASTIERLPFPGDQWDFLHCSTSKAGLTASYHRRRDN